MQSTQVKIALLLVMLTVAPACVLAAPGISPSFPGAAVSGVVRNGQGVAQLGALVQVLLNDTVPVGYTFTDLHGRYLIANLLPGKYQVRASGSLFVPAQRGNLQLRPGVRSVVNLTLNTLFDTASWLPAERRKADEPSDDWRWTLRSAANRPILRMVENGQIVMVSTSESQSKHPVDRARASMITGDGAFGGGGLHNVVAVDRVLDDGANLRLRADIGSARGPLVAGPSTDLTAGYERRLGPGGISRVVAAYQSHPELMSAGRGAGFQAMQIASAQKMQLGDLADVEVGSAFFAVHTAGYAMASHPFLRVTMHPTSDWSVGYRMATTRELQAFDGLETMEMDLPLAAKLNGKMQTERGLHQQVTVGRKAGRGMVQASYYRDALAQVFLTGGGVLRADDLNGASNAGVESQGVISDTSTGSFKVLSAGYRAQGMNVMLTEPITPGMWVAVEYSSGMALAAGDLSKVTLANVTRELSAEAAHSLAVALKGRVIHTGTQVRAAYRWQPEHLVTAINPYAAFGDQAYLSFYLRQPIRVGRMLPPGLEATIDVTNLMAQGYRPFVSADGHTLFLAQSPRTMQAGLAFTF